MEGKILKVNYRWAMCCGTCHNVEEDEDGLYCPKLEQDVVCSSICDLYKRIDLNDDNR